ncbi:MAG TPA: PhzF family phenazine biosynthesis protein [Mycobacterium sp.]|uniref:PhzF family phenazine biosynthesis protein n=1 Tax=Mycobacterium sp. TaxID=1785 RepID=UPI002D64B575|nr:PhzF family phenazine biosynthesis protein [Mycobacterium sp.]HXY65310.1 PhzF family phenazine biosynthesis protein [Mycobacterium sp.]
MRVYVVDTFTQNMFRGNPTGVVLVDQPVDPDWMQAVAAELNQPATAFVDTSSPDAPPEKLRWFSPTTELTLCGSGTLAAAHILGGDRTFQTRGGTLSCTAGSGGTISMRFPADPPHPEPLTDELTQGLPGITVCSVWRGRHDVLVEAESAAEVRALIPNPAVLANIAARAVIITAAGDRDADIVSRVFAPRAGIVEDPVTGSAHCTLASWWSERLAKPELLAEQASQRGGLLRIRSAGDHVALIGHAVTVCSGNLHV